MDELANRLNSLINTHGQNSYLKKSPMIVAFQKLLRFVNGVQGRGGVTQEGGTTVPCTMRLNEIDLDFDSDPI